MDPRIDLNSPTAAAAVKAASDLVLSDKLVVARSLTVPQTAAFIGKSARVILEAMASEKVAIDDDQLIADVTSGRRTINEARRESGLPAAG